MVLRAVVGGTVLSLFCASFVFAQTNDDVEARVRAYFEDVPVMAAIAKCESEFKQFGKGGTPLYGGMGGSMVGVFQIHEGVHRTFAQSIGMDIDTLEGNLAYARYLYEKEGTQPWLSSFPCWSGEEKGVPISAHADLITANLSLGMVHPQVHALQKKLNALGYTVAPEGPGSPGNETTKFGALTRAAVKKFQCEKMQICDGDEYTNGYGFVGAKTRTALADAPLAPAVSSANQESSSTTPSTDYTPEQQAEITRLQAQIAELTKVLAELLAQHAS